MKQNLSFALHDIRVSWNENAVIIIRQVMEIFEVPLTVHLIFDQPIELSSPLEKFIIEHINSNKLEIVFHGLTHECSKKVSKFWVFYHKYQAEYLDDNDVLRENTKTMFKSASNLFERNLGICPPCWIATKRNFQFFRTLSPLYTEKILSLNTDTKNWFSPVISLGSPNNSELFFLRTLARLIYYVSIITRSKRVRVAIHICDMENPRSVQFFSEIITSLKKRNYNALLLNELVK